MRTLREPCNQPIRERPPHFFNRRSLIAEGDGPGTLAAYRKADCPRFFRHDNRNRVGFLGDANAGSMSRPQLR